MRLEAERGSGDSVAIAPSIPRASTIRSCPYDPIVGFNRARLGSLEVNVGDGMLAAILIGQRNQAPGGTVVSGMKEARTVAANPDLAIENRYDPHP